ncbi:MAG: deoxycytidylate deaminase [Proteobacteria bacterium]|nr:deoxycytidylate deaminase [Pseudomonadota bacterium]
MMRNKSLLGRMTALNIISPKTSDVDGIDDLFEVSSAAVRKLQTDEIVVGLCAPAGSPVHRVAEYLARLLEQRYGYECEIIRLSRFIETIGGAVTSSDSFQRIQGLIDKGNELRRRYGHSLLADLAISQIAKEREKAKVAGDQSRYSGRRICYIIDSIKNLDELDMLRLVYREMFYFVGVFAPLHIRQKDLQTGGMALEQVHRVIDRDSGEELAHGQLVRDTFPMADFFVRTGAGSDKELESKLERFLDLILRARLVTPTYAETAMYQAASAAGNSACLSRQVGAAVTDTDGDLLAIGWNDVPRFGGGLYRADRFFNGEPTVADNRCYNWKGGKCWNDQEKDLLARRAIDTLVESGIVSEVDRARAVEALNESPIKDVYYIEPYRKSLATKLHDDAITEDEEAADKVRILPFDGVSPRRYLDLFQMSTSPRKSKGQVVQLDPRHVHPVTSGMLESVPALEGLVVQSLVSRKILEG